MQIARRYLKSPADVADVVQESFIAVFEGIDRFAGQAQLRTWMHRIVVNKALMRLRTQKRHGEVAIDDLLPRFLPDGHQALETQPWRPGADAELVSRHTQAQVRRAIDQLPEAYRTVLLLRDIDEIESSEAAQLLGITEGALRVRLHRARQALRGLLAPLFAESGDVPAGSEPVAASAGSRPCR
jgi:RNA polymerase sigma-70 factor (ECF subfamily)